MSKTRPKTELEKKEEEAKSQQPVKPVLYTKPEELPLIIPDTSVPHQSNVKKMSNDVIHKIASYLNGKEAYRFFVTSRHTHHVMEKSCINKTFYGTKLYAMIRAAHIGILEYKAGWNDIDSMNLKYGPHGRIYPKGYQRATCFLDTLQNKEIALPLKLFALYVLLKESNGRNLKSYVKNNLSLHFGNNILQEIDANVREMFENDTVLLEQMEKKLLAIIHDKRTGVRYGDHVNFDWGCMKFYIEELEREARASLNAKSKKGGCSIS